MPRGGKIPAIPTEDAALDLGESHRPTMESLVRDYQVGGATAVGLSELIGDMIVSTLKSTMTMLIGNEPQPVQKTLALQFNPPMMADQDTQETQIPPNYGPKLSRQSNNWRGLHGKW